MADNLPADGKITATEWFQFASGRVPELQLQALENAQRLGRLLTFDTGMGDRDSGRLQTPRLYFRRDLSSPELVVAVH